MTDYKVVDETIKSMLARGEDVFSEANTKILTNLGVHRMVKDMFSKEVSCDESKKKLIEDTMTAMAERGEFIGSEENQKILKDLGCIMTTYSADDLTRFVLYMNHKVESA